MASHVRYAEPNCALGEPQLACMYSLLHMDAAPTTCTSDSGHLNAAQCAMLLIFSAASYPSSVDLQAAVWRRLAPAGIPLAAGTGANSGRRVLQGAGLPSSGHVAALLPPSSNGHAGEWLLVPRRAAGGPAAASAAVDPAAVGAAVCHDIPLLFSCALIPNCKRASHLPSSCFSTTGRQFPGV